MNARTLIRCCTAALALLILFQARSLRAADSLAWNTNQNQVSADIHDSSLLAVLERIATVTGWHVFVEPGSKQSVSAKFSKLPPGQALPLLFGDLNFALIPETNGPSRLFVFHTARQNATQLVSPEKTATADTKKPIPNELIVRLKPGADIDEIARRLGAKVVGRIDGLNAYRLRFDDETATDSARTDLASNADVTSVESNYSLERPLPAMPASGSPMPPPALQLKPPPDDGRVIVGLVDTAVQPLGNNLDQFLLKQLSVAGDAAADPSSPLHGTSMAETLLRSLAAITKGSSSVQILPVDVYGPNPSTSTFDVANGIVQAVNGGAKIINMSLGSEGDSSFLHDVIKAASGKNIIFVGAAGNTPVTTPYYPAAYSEVMAVTAVDHGQIAPYANRGSFVSLGAPGTSVIYFNNQPYYVLGTSASAAFTSGIAAGYMETHQATSQNTQDYLRSNFGVTIGSGK